MSSLTSGVAQPPWTYSAALGEFVYLSQSDEIALRDGSRYARPRHIPAKSLDSARYNGPLSRDGGNYVIEGGRSRAFSAPASHNGRLPAGMASLDDRIQMRDSKATLPDGSPAAAPRVERAMGPKMQMTGLKRSPPKPTQNVLSRPRGQLPAVSPQGTKGLIYSKEPVRQGNIVRAVSDGHEQRHLPLLPDATHSQVPRNEDRGPLRRTLQAPKPNGESTRTKKTLRPTRDQSSKGSAQSPRFSRDINVHINTSSPSQRQPGNSAPGSDQNACVVRVGNNGVLLTMLPGFAGRKRDRGDIGKIVLMLCGEPIGGSSEAPMWTQGINLTQTGGRVFARVERYVIIDSGPADKPYCIALPIKTYGGRGVAASGVVKSHHCVIYSSSRPPVPLERERPGRNEDGMRQPPIGVILDDPRNPDDWLDPVSRVHLVGARAIEDQDRTRDFGRVSPQSERDLISHFWTLWGRNRPLPRPPSEPQEGSDDDDEDEESEDNEDGAEEGDEDEDAEDDNDDGDDSGDGSDDEQQE
jgi:hypothetical protein